MARCMLHNVELRDGKCPVCHNQATNPELSDSRIHHRFVVMATSDLYRCPNTGRIIDAGKGDDKVLCRCGKPNPNSAWEMQYQMRGLHLVRLLDTATEEEFWQQRQADLKKKEDGKA